MICCNCGNDNLEDLPDTSINAEDSYHQWCPDCKRETVYHESFQINGLSYEADIVKEPEGYVVRQWRFNDPFEGWLPDGNPSDPFPTFVDAVRAMHLGIEDQKLINGSL